MEDRFDRLCDQIHEYIAACRLDGYVLLYHGCSILVYPCMSAFNVEVKSLDGPYDIASHADTLDEAVQLGMEMAEDRDWFEGRGDVR